MDWLDLLAVQGTCITTDKASGGDGIPVEAGRDWGQEETGTTEDEMAGWHH